MMKLVPTGVEIIVGKEENAGHLQHFLFSHIVFKSLFCLTGDGTKKSFGEALIHGERYKADGSVFYYMILVTQNTRPRPSFLDVWLFYQLRSDLPRPFMDSYDA